jgi:hypothetical protein
MLVIKHQNYLVKWTGVHFPYSSNKIYLKNLSITKKYLACDLTTSNYHHHRFFIMRSIPFKRYTYIWQLGVIMDRDPNGSSQNVKALNKL